jgi:asparagine synthase (glutamine-hydrolysing)
MCGIVGIVPRAPGDPGQLSELVRRMAGAIVHRGPDDEGFFVTPRIALGVRRLSIIDVQGGHQPIATADGSRVIVFNGEIYNFQELRSELAREGRSFKTACDTEVVLQAFDAWGPDGIRRLEGMFALAIWDERAGRLTLARDWLGQKSIYYAETEVGWVFASEIKALLALNLLPRETDFEALSHYMSLRYLPGKSTLFVGVSKVPAAHRVEVSGKDRLFQRYWTPAYEPKLRGSETEVLEALDAVLRKIIPGHLISDVPLGAFLSGGIDSSLVVAYASLVSGEPVRTFSIGVDDASQSELPWARKVAERYRTRHFEKIVAPDLAGMAPEMTAALEEPVDPFAAGVYIVSQITSEQVTVALGGDGGDELFAGYDRYLGQQLAETFSSLPSPLRRKVLRPLFRMVPESFGYKSLATKLRWLDEMAEKDGVARYAESAAFLRFPHALKAGLFGEKLWSDLERKGSETLLEEHFNDGCAEAFVDKMLHADFTTRLADHQLPIVDRMSMAHSLEVRNPFLDHRVAEFAMRIPAGWKMKGRRIKYVTRKLGERYLPRDLLYRKKQGFGFPLALWIRGDLRSLMQRTVKESHLAAEGIFRREEMRRLLEEHLGGRIDHNFRLWMIFNLEIWFRHYMEGEPVAHLREWVERAKAA